MLPIPDRISSEARGIVTLTVLERIMKKIDWAMRIGQQQTACGEESPRLYVTPGKLTHLKKMQELGLAEKEPIHRRGCKCDPKVNPKNAYALTQKAWNWYILCHSLSCIKDLG